MKDSGTSSTLQTLRKWVGSCKTLEQLNNLELFILKAGYYVVMEKTIKTKRLEYENGI